MFVAASQVDAVFLDSAGDSPLLRGPKATFSRTLRCGNRRGSCARSAIPRECGGSQMRLVRGEVEQDPVPDDCPSGIRAEQAGNDGQERRLAGAVGTQHRQGLPGSEGQRDLEVSGIERGFELEGHCAACIDATFFRGLPVDKADDRGRHPTRTRDSATAASASVSRWR